MIVVTGGAGFIGSNLVRRLNGRGEDDLLVVDDLSDSSRIRNLRDCRFADDMDKAELRARIEDRTFPRPGAICHQGACSDTMERDGRYRMEVNDDDSKSLLHDALARSVPFVYACSASVYGAGHAFTEHPANEDALNVYAFSKRHLDRCVRRHLPDAQSQVVGLRYFNVYGPGEAHKGRMASVAFHFHHRYGENGQVRLFVDSGGYGGGAQERDFVWVEDVVDVNLHCMDHPDMSGIFNVGTGARRSFNDLALAVINAGANTPMTLAGALEARRIPYIPFPDRLRDKYQSDTCADPGTLRNAGYEQSFTGLEQGVSEYIKQLTANR